MLKRTLTLIGVSTAIGVLFILMGVLGFIPAFVSNGYLFGFLYVNTTLNVLHLLTGIIAIWAGGSPRGARLFFKIFGIIYSAIAILGFLYLIVAFEAIYSGVALLGLLYLILGVICLYLGYIANLKR